MDNFLKMDVFFVVTTVVAVIGGILVIIAMYYVVKILRNLDEVMKNVQEESSEIRMDINLLRKKARDEGMKIKHIADFFGTIASRRTSPRQKHKVKEE